VDRVALTARVTAFLQQRLFTEGTEVKQGDLLYTLERPPFEAAVAQQEAAVADASARLANANIQLTRAQSLLSTPAGQRSSVDDATAAQRSQAAQLMGSQAQLRIAQINLAYTEIHAPIGGKISRTNISVGNVVSPGSGPLASIVSQDPMYVVFPIAVRTEIDLEKRYADQGGMGAVVIKLRLPDGKLYNQTGTIDYIEPSVQATTDTILLRGKIDNPPLKPIEAGKPVDRPLIDGEFVTVLVEGIQPVEALAIPRAAVLSDQQGDYVYVVDAKNTVEQRRVQIGQSTPSAAVIMAGLKEGDMVVLEGIQRVRPGIQVVPGPAAPAPAAPKPAGQ
jgi:membrane fusion protein (multidrug efflux system)